MKDKLRFQFAGMSFEGLAQLYAQSLLMEHDILQVYARFFEEERTAVVETV